MARGGCNYTFMSSSHKNGKVQPCKNFTLEILAEPTSKLRSLEIIRHGLLHSWECSLDILNWLVAGNSTFPPGLHLFLSDTFTERSHFESDPNLLRGWIDRGGLHCTVKLWDEGYEEQLWGCAALFQEQICPAVIWRGSGKDPKVSFLFPLIFEQLGHHVVF